MKLEMLDNQYFYAHGHIIMGKYDSLFAFLYTLEYVEQQHQKNHIHTWIFTFNKKCENAPCDNIKTT